MSDMFSKVKKNNLVNRFNTIVKLLVLLLGLSFCVYDPENYPCIMLLLTLPIYNRSVGEGRELEIAQ